MGCYKHVLTTYVHACMHKCVVQYQASVASKHDLGCVLSLHLHLSASFCVSQCSCARRLISNDHLANSAYTFTAVVGFKLGGYSVHNRQKFALLIAAKVLRFQCQSFLNGHVFIVCVCVYDLECD